MLIILFVIFDVELALLFPLSFINFFQISLKLILTLLVILIILLVGVFLEWHNGALDWKLY